MEETEITIKSIEFDVRKKNVEPVKSKYMNQFISIIFLLFVSSSIQAQNSYLIECDKKTDELVISKPDGDSKTKKEIIACQTSDGRCGNSHG